MKRYLCIIILGICFLTGCSKGNETGGNIAGLNNSYFFSDDTASCTYEGFVFWHVPEESEEIVLSVTKVQSFEEGNLYELVINTEGSSEDRLGIDRSRLDFFLVLGDDIYLIDDGTAKDLTIDKIKSKGKLVCSQTEKEASLKDNEPGWHECIIAEGNIREYHGYNNMAETGYYESFIWEYGKGLVGYRSGYGAEADAINITRN